MKAPQQSTIPPLPSFANSFNLKVLNYTYLLADGERLCHGMWRADDRKLILFSHHVGSGNQTQAIRLGGWCLCVQSPLTGPSPSILQPNLMKHEILLDTSSSLGLVEYVSCRQMPCFFTVCTTENFPY